MGNILNIFSVQKEAVRTKHYEVKMLNIQKVDIQ